MKLSTTATALVAASFDDYISGKVKQNLKGDGVRFLQSICSCSPRDFTFTLSLSEDCDTNSLELKPGIEETDCTIADASALTPVGGNATIDVDNIGGVTIEEIVACIPWLDNCRAKKNEETGEDIGRFLQSGNLVPSIITSIQYIELDENGFVILIDDSQNNLQATSGDSFSYTSVSSQLDPTQDISTQLDMVPVTAVLFVVGQNDQGEEIRGRFVWKYTNGCGLDERTITGGEEYAWIRFDQVDRAIPEFCPSNNADSSSPTPSPLVIDIFPTPPPMESSPPSIVDSPVPTVVSIGPTSSPVIINTFPTFFPSKESSVPSTSPITPELLPTLQPTFPKNTDEPSLPRPSPIPMENFPTPQPTTDVFPTFFPSEETRPSSKPSSSPVVVKFFPTLQPTNGETSEPSPKPIAVNRIPSLQPTFFPTLQPTLGTNFEPTRSPTEDSTPYPTSYYGYGQEIITITDDSIATHSKNEDTNPNPTNSFYGYGKESIMVETATEYFDVHFHGSKTGKSIRPHEGKSAKNDAKSMRPHEGKPGKGSKGDLGKSSKVDCNHYYDENHHASSHDGLGANKKENSHERHTIRMLRSNNYK